MAGWATLKFFGHEGFQSVLGGILENKVYLQQKIKDHPSIVCVNPDDFGLVTLLRIYPPGVNANFQYEYELKDKNYKEDLLTHNKLTHAIGDLLFEWFRSGKRINGQCTPYLSFTSKFRPTEYNRELIDSEAMIFALKIFPLNVSITPLVMDHVLTCIGAARDQIMQLNKTEDGQ
jgi:hypothetical protein